MTGKRYSLITSWIGAYKRLPAYQRRVAPVTILAVAVIGISLIFVSHAATPAANVEAEAGAVTSPATTVTDSSASGGSAVKFGSGSTPSLPTFIPANTPPSGYSLAFDDEFNGTSIDSTKWNELTNSNYGSSNNEDECYNPSGQPNTITESGGDLNIAATYVAAGFKCGGANPDVTSPTTVNGQSTADNYFASSGFMTTRAAGNAGQTYSFLNGYVEADIEMPKGNPYWGAFWLVGGTPPASYTTVNPTPGWPQYGEFDITELLGVHPDVSTGTFHYPCSTGSNCSNGGANLYNFNPASGTANTYDSNANLGTELTPANYSAYSGYTTSNFVRYGFLWQSNRITWYLNGIPTRSLDTAGVLTTYTTWDANGNPIASTTKTLTASTTPFSTIFATYHAIDLNLAFGGASPRYASCGSSFNQGCYTGIESADGTSYNAGNMTSPAAQGTPESMKVDYVRVYQP